MEPITLLLVISIPALIAGVALAVQNRIAKETRIVELARERSNQRIAVRAFADTAPETAHIDDALEYITVSGISVYEDGCNAHGVPLTDEQINTINLIFDGYAIPAKHRPKNVMGPNVHIASGVPLNLSALDENNTVTTGAAEYLEPEFAWPVASNHHG